MKLPNNVKAAFWSLNGTGRCETWMGEGLLPSLTVMFANQATSVSVSPIERGCNLGLLWPDNELQILTVSKQIQAFILWNAEQSATRLRGLSNPGQVDLEKLLELRRHQIIGEVGKEQYTRAYRSAISILQIWQDTQPDNKQKLISREVNVLRHMLGHSVLGCSTAFDYLWPESRSLSEWLYYEAASIAAAEKELARLIAQSATAHTVKGILAEYMATL